jgi:hypothetical protein
MDAIKTPQLGGIGYWVSGIGLKEFHYEKYTRTPSNPRFTFSFNKFSILDFVPAENQ